MKSEMYKLAVGDNDGLPPPAAEAAILRLNMQISESKQILLAAAQIFSRRVQKHKSRRVSVKTVAI